MPPYVNLRVPNGCYDEFLEGDEFQVCLAKVGAFEE